MAETCFAELREKAVQALARVGLNDPDPAGLAGQLGVGHQQLVEIPKTWGELPVRSRYVELAPWLFVLGTILFLLEILERRTGWVLRLFRRKAAVAQVEAEEAEAPKATPPPRPVFPRPVPKSTRTATAPAAAQTKSTAPVSTTLAEPKPAPEKPASTASTFDALRKARERSHRRTDKDR
jgi:hypothetical protein